MFLSIIDGIGMGAHYLIRCPHFHVAIVGEPKTLLSYITKLALSPH